MAKKSSIAKQKQRAACVERHRARRDHLRLQAKNIHISDEEREVARVALNKMVRDSSPSRLKNRCQLTGRPHAYLRKFGVSRICFRELASMGMIPGVIKASW